MKVYKVKVNGKVYEVEVESVTESNATITTPSKAPVTEEKVLQLYQMVQVQI